MFSTHRPERLEMMKLLKEAKGDYLIEKQFPSLLRSQIHLLHCHPVSRLWIESCAYGSSRSFSDLYKILEIISWISWTYNHFQSFVKLCKKIITQHLGRVVEEVVIQKFKKTLLQMKWKCVKRGESKGIRRASSQTTDKMWKHLREQNNGFLCHVILMPYPMQSTPSLKERGGSLPFLWAANTIGNLI